MNKLYGKVVDAKYNYKLSEEQLNSLFNLFYDAQKNISNKKDFELCFQATSVAALKEKQGKDFSIKDTEMISTGFFCVRRCVFLCSCR